MNSWTGLGFGLLLSSLWGCAGASAEHVKPLPPPDPPKAARHFSDSLSEMGKLDDANAWTDAKCSELSTSFADAAAMDDRLRSVALHNAALVEQRCHRDKEARALLQQVLERDPGFHPARVQLARLMLASGGDQALPQVIAELERAITDAKYQNADALVELARAQMRRGSEVPDKEGANDLERAKRNLQRALAVDDGSLPAQNQLALYYLARAKKAAPARAITRSVERRTGETQAIDLALLVATQGLKKAPDNAPLLNTTGLVLVELGDLPQAVKHFAKARKLDPSFLAAHMNYASVNMMFRGFNEAEAAYRIAVALSTDDYDAHLGLALALRGQLEATETPEKLLAESERLLEAAKKIDPARPEAYFNHAVLVQEYKTREGGKQANKALGEAIGLYREFVKRAEGKPELADAVFDVVAKPHGEERDCMGARGRTDRACKRGRILDAQDIIAFNEQNEAEQARLREEMMTDAARREAISE
jgi:tetratricopeptide (TPR) repeat protein